MVENIKVLPSRST